MQLIRKSERGTGFKVQAAFSASYGELVALFGSDDCFLPHMLDRCSMGPSFFSRLRSAASKKDPAMVTKEILYPSVFSN